MPTYRIILFGFLLLFIGSCQKNENPDPPVAPAFEMTVHNEFNLTEAEYAVFLSDEDGVVRAFRQLPGNDTARVSVADAKTGEVFDCTVARITTLTIPGTGVYDTTVVLTTYTNLSNGAEIHLRSPDFVQTTDLLVNLTNFNTLDAIVVPDGLTFAQPQAGNNYQGEYRVLHSGRFWLRLRINGESNWRYATFDPVNSATLTVTLDAAALPAITAAPATITLPFFAAWNGRIDRVIDAGQQQFLSIGGLIPVPGGPIPIFDQLNVIEPPNPSAGAYRLRLSGADVTPGGYTYFCDRVASPLPATLPEPTFDVQTHHRNRAAGDCCKMYRRVRPAGAHPRTNRHYQLPLGSADGARRQQWYRHQPPAGCSERLERPLFPAKKLRFFWQLGAGTGGKLRPVQRLSGCRCPAIVAGRSVVANESGVCGERA
jgi:hypothetical protein